jgi:hypothetical protein
MYFAKQKNILSKYKKVASLATTEPNYTLSEKLLPFVSTVTSYTSDVPSFWLVLLLLLPLLQQQQAILLNNNKEIVIMMTTIIIIIEEEEEEQ